MKKSNCFQLFTLLLVSLTTQASYAENASVKVKDISTDSRDTAVIIKKGNLKSLTQKPTIKYELLSHESEISGEPEAGSQEAYQNWKKACESWKSETKELNEDNQIIALNCGSPSMSPSNYGQKVYRSTGVLKVKVKMSEPTDSDNDDGEED